jgi:serine carboxypeptidase-like clade 2
MAGSRRRTPPTAAAALAWLLLGCVCALGYPESDLVRGLPGQPPVAFRQFAGYVDVDERAGRSLFYYLAEADGAAAASKPLTLWLNGGAYQFDRS